MPNLVVRQNRRVASVVKIGGKGDKGDPGDQNVLSAGARRYQSAVWDPIQGKYVPGRVRGVVDGHELAKGDRSQDDAAGIQALLDEARAATLTNTPGDVVGRPRVAL